MPMPVRAWSPWPWVITARGTGRQGSMWKSPGGQYRPSGVCTTRSRAIRARSAQVDLADLVAIVLLRVDAQQHLDARNHAVGVHPHLGVLGVEPQQAELGVVLAVIPGSDEPVPQPVHDRPVRINARAAADAGEPGVVLGCKASDREAAAFAQLLHQHVVGGGEDPDWRTAVLAERGHRSGVAGLLAVKATHH